MEDTIVYSGISHSEFVSSDLSTRLALPVNRLVQASEITGRTVKDARRYGDVYFRNNPEYCTYVHTGKLFFIELDGKGRFPVLHFGMTGMLQVCILLLRLALPFNSA